VPDHGKLAPWRFILFEGAGRERAGEIFVEFYAKANPGGDDRRVEAERNAPLVVGVISRAAPQQKIPEWEQILSAGAVCMNLMVAANALGFASIWLADWVAYDRAVLAQLGVAENERVAGFIHIGHDAREDRARPHLADIVTRF
jgi:nitroreductase